MPFESWEGDNGLSKTTIIILAMILFIASVAGVYAVYNIVSPPSDTVTVDAPATLTKPTLNATSATIGQIIQITTTLSDGAEGLQVWFYENDQQIGSAYTNDQGTAIYNRAMNSAGSFVFRAECIHP